MDIDSFKLDWGAIVELQITVEEYCFIHIVVREVFLD